MTAQQLIGYGFPGRPRPPWSLFAALFLCSLSLGSANAQWTSCSLEGTIIDTLGKPIVGVNVIVTGQSIQGMRTGSTDEHGHFAILGLPPGKDTVLIEHVGYQSVKVADVSTLLGRTTHLGDIRLHQRTHEIAEVIVSGKKPLIDPASTSVGGNLHSDDIEGLPVERNYRSIATLIPGANVSYLNDEVNIAGATGRENKYFIDGVDVTDPTFGKVGTNLPYNFVKEIEVMTGGYEAEYKSVLGGIVNVITYSGSNEVHGSAFGFFTNNRLSASRRGGLLDATQGGFSNYDMGFGIGGPIIRDELWFYAAYNPTFNHVDVEIPGFGKYLDKTVMHSFAGKLTWRASRRLNLVITSTGDPTVRKAVGDIPADVTAPKRLANPDPFLTDQTDGGVNLSVQGSYVVADDILIDASFSRIARNQTWEHSTEFGKNDTVLIDELTKTWSGGGFGRFSFFRSGTSGRVGSSIVAQSHILKGGVEYREIYQEIDMDQPVWISRTAETAYQFNANGTHGSVKNRILSAYLQDRWQISSRLLINSGVRLDGQWVYGGDGSIVHLIEGPIQPRLGFVWLLGKGGTQKIYGSFGRFVQEWTSAFMTCYTGDIYFRMLNYSQDPRNVGMQGGVGTDVVSDIPGKTVLRGQHYDEFNLGYELLASRNLKLGVQGTYRTFGEAINVGVVPEGLLMGNPGWGVLSDFPMARRNYSALSLTAEGRGGDHFSFLASYVLSRNYGNYDGVFDSYNNNIPPNVNWMFSDISGLQYATGLLCNDRTHVFKFSGSYRFEFGLIAGTSFTWQTGTPLSEIGSNDWFLQPRGSVGRTPGIWDLNARLMYPWVLSGGIEARLILDVLHIAGQRKPVAFVQQHYFRDDSGDPDFTKPNSSYGEPTAFQPAMSVRLGMEVKF